MAKSDFSSHLNALSVWSLTSWTEATRVCSHFSQCFRRSQLSERDKQLSLEHITQIIAYLSTQKWKRDFLKLKNRCLEKPCHPQWPSGYSVGCFTYYRSVTPNFQLALHSKRVSGGAQRSPTLRLTEYQGWVKGTSLTWGNPDIPGYLSRKLRF